MRVEFHPEALAEFEDAAHYYAGIQNSLAQRFISAVERSIIQIAEAPDRWLILEHDIRRCLTRVFPFVVLYTIETDYVLIVAVMHCHRQPGYWRHRLAV